MVHFENGWFTKEFWVTGQWQQTITSPQWTYIYTQLLADQWLLVIGSLTGWLLVAIYELQTTIAISEVNSSLTYGWLLVLAKQCSIKSMTCHPWHTTASIPAAFFYQSTRWPPRLIHCWQINSIWKENFWLLAGYLY